MLTIKDLILEDGTYLVPHRLHEDDEEYVKDVDFEKMLIEEGKNDPQYKDLEHKPFVDWVKLKGRKKFRALLVPSTKDEFDEYMKEVDLAHKKQLYWDRCPISDGKGKIKQCPRQIPNPDYGKIPDAPQTIMKRCDTCPIYRAWKNKSKITSLEGMIYNDEGEEVDTGYFGRSAVSEDDIMIRVRNLVLDAVVDINSRYGKVIMKALDDNLSINEACDSVKEKQSSVYKFLKSKRFQESVLEKLLNDPLIDIEKLL